MLKKLLISMALFALSALVLTACGGTETSNGNSNNTATDNKTSTSSTPKASDTSVPTNSSANGDDKIGIPECDDYLAKYEACVSGKVPEAARAQYKTSLEQLRKSWRGLAANPNTKGGLKMACETAITQAKQQFQMYGCDF